MNLGNHMNEGDCGSRENMCMHINLYGVRHLAWSGNHVNANKTRSWRPRKPGVRYLYIKKLRYHYIKKLQSLVHEFRLPGTTI